MSRRSRTRVIPSPPMADPGPNHGGAAGKGRRVAGISPGKLWRSLGAKVSSVFGLASVSSASASRSPDSVRSSRSAADPIHESHSAEAFRDCVKFLNSFVGSEIDQGASKLKEI